MRIYLEKAVFVNRAPFERLDLTFDKDEIAVLAAVNGRGKTTILSHIVDAFYEMAKPIFPQEFEKKENKLYRVSSTVENLVRDNPSFVYLRFYTDEGNIDYVDIRNICTEEDYNIAIPSIDNKIPFNEIKSHLESSNYVKRIRSNFDNKKMQLLFSSNVLTYFPSYRYEQPGYLNDVYKIKLNFRANFNYTGFLTNPIEVISGLPQLTNWIMDVILDNQYLNVQQGDLIETIKKMGISGVLPVDQLPALIEIVNNLTIQEKSTIKKNLSLIITNALSSKNYGNLRFGIGPRSFGGLRVQVLNSDNGTQIYPTIFNLSSGEASILCLFGELLRQADNIKSNIELYQITGIVLIDEVDKHLHIKLQKEVLPRLFKLFPSVQFIVSSHSPFLNMGLAEELMERSKIIDLDTFGISKDPTTNELYKEVYSMIINENENFRELYYSINKKIEEGQKPLIITEGKTDVKHIRKAKEILNINDCDIEFHEIDGDWGESKLKTLLEQLSKVRQARKIIGIFDRDIPKILFEIEESKQPFKKYGNNVYAFCIPVPTGRELYSNISIEFYYSDEEIKKDKNGKRLYFDNEVEQLFNKRTKKNEIRQLSTPIVQTEYEKKIFCEDIGDEIWIHSKTRFAEIVETDERFINGFNFNNFNLIFEKIKEIISDGD